MHLHMGARKNFEMIKMKHRVALGSILLLFMALMVVAGCKDTAQKVVNDIPENKEAKKLLQGIWINEDESDVAFQVKGDTIYYPDSTSVPVYFKVLEDTLVLFGANEVKYPIEKQTANLFIFRTPAGDKVRLVLSKDVSLKTMFDHQAHTTTMLNQGKLLKRDSVVVFDNNKYHYYVQVNPTTYKVYKSMYNDDGVLVDNVYYDNIVHLGIYKGTEKLYSHDFYKSDFSSKIEKSVLTKGILNDIVYSGISAEGLMFRAIIGVPDSPSSYYVDIKVNYQGRVKLFVD